MSCDLRILVAWKFEELLFTQITYSLLLTSLIITEIISPVSGFFIGAGFTLDLLPE